MTSRTQSYAEYMELSAEERTLSRLLGAAEVLEASGLFVLRAPDTTQRDDMAQAESLEFEIERLVGSEEPVGEEKPNAEEEPLRLPDTVWPMKKA